MKEIHDTAPKRLLNLGNGYTRVYYNTTEVAREESTNYESDYVDVQGILHSDKIVDALIRERYTLSEELAINRQKESRPGEFLDYYNYCEWCKEEAKGICVISEN